MTEGRAGMQARAERRWLFGPAVLDERTLELRVGGEPVEVERKSLQILMHLLNHAGEVVTKDEMLAAVWPGRILSDSVLTSCMARLREALRDADQALIKTVHGYGYRLIAPVKVESSPSLAPARFEFKAGEHLPARPLWSLVERLGTGGHGEAWLARHDKTHERRVYKFAADGEALVTLKREITIYRLLHDTLGDRPELVRLFDWNLEEPPFFLEYDYLEAGSLTTWAKAQGGLDGVPLGTRLDLVAQIADALAAAHSVGVLHKDLKPSNVLIDPGKGGAPQIKLCDFGSGGVLDLARLEQMGITRLGFTRTIGAFDAAGITPLYLAPEVAAGQPFTVKADIYALGVLLYQLAVGNFHKALAPGWEQDVPDELLRQDIAAAAEGHPELRLADAGRLAQRLRALDQRRRQLEADRAAAAEADNAKMQMERMRARRTWVRLAMAALVAGVTVSSTLYVDARRSRDAAAEAAMTSEAVSDFLSKDMLASINVEERPVRDLTLREVLDNASAQVDRRFAGRPDISAKLHAALGGAYYSLTQTREAKVHLGRAIALFDEAQGAGSEGALDAAATMVELENSLGELPTEMPKLDAVLRHGTDRLGPRHPRVLALRRHLAHGHYWLGHWKVATEMLRALLADSVDLANPAGDFRARTQYLLGSSVALSGDLAGGEALTRGAIATLTGAVGPDHLSVGSARRSLGEILMDRGRHDEAETELAAALRIAQRWVREDSGNVLSVRLTLAQLRMEQSRIPEAMVLASQALRVLAASPVQAKDQTMWFREVLARAHQQQGNLKQAETEMTQAVVIGEKSLTRDHPAVDRFRIALADILCDERRYEAASALLKTVNHRMLADLSPAHPYLGHLRRVEGRLLRDQGEHAKALAAWTEARRIYDATYGAENPRSRWVEQALARLPAARARGGT